MSFLTIGPITANTYRTGSYEYLVDGYGTLITPAGNFPNTLRIKLRHVFTDSIVYTGVPMPTDIIQSFSTTYFWASTDAGDKLYQFFIGYDTTITDAVISTFKTVNFQKITTGIAENIPNDVPAALIYPNPATEFATLRITNPVSGLATLDLYNNNGQLVKSASVSMINNNFFEWRISLTDFAPGLYTVKISCKSQSWMTRILKQ
jgi:hypothetical protein